jgi:hypothetical protein
MNLLLLMLVGSVFDAEMAGAGAGTFYGSRLKVFVWPPGGASL